MTPELLQQLQQKWPWLTAVVSIVGVLRLCIKPVNTFVQTRLTAVVLEYAKSKDQEDDRFVVGILGSRTYRILVFLFDLFLSIKLPRLNDFSAARAEATTTK